MSLSLSSLLNPSPDAEAPSQSSPPPPHPSSSSSTRNDTLPSIQYVQSPERQFVTSPQSAHHAPHQYSYPLAPDHDAVHPLASLPGSSAPPPVQSQWYPAQVASESTYDTTRRSNSYERRPGSSGYGEPIQLPPPPSTARQNSSPTLDQYHVPSRSPDYRRASMISPAEPTFTLPPIHSISPTQQLDHSKRPPSSHGQSSIYDNPQLPVSRVEESTASPRTEGRKEHTSSLDGAPPSDNPKQSPPAKLQPNTSNASASSERMDSSPAAIKQEALGTPRASLPADNHVHSALKSDTATTALKPFTSTKSEHSPLRDSSVPVPSTESAVPEPAPSKKRPAPAKTKKGTATTTKKAPPAKKRKVESSKLKPIDRALTPLKALSSKGATPATSSPAPSTRSVSAEPDDDVYEDDDDESGDAGSSDDVYCLCRKPDTGTFMIGCDGTCDDWFHGKCVGIEERDKNLIDKYICPTCTKAGAGQTTWKRMCRRSGCRQAARVGKAGKGGKEGGGSKYCSEECGVLYFRDMVAKTRGKEEMGKNRHSRRKNSIASPVQSRDRDPDDDLGARGGLLASGELKALVNTSMSADEFKKLGDGVLSPPATPDSKASPTASKDSKYDFTEPEAQALSDIHKQKNEARRKHALLKDRMKFVTMVKHTASRTATEKELKPKEYCGYDSRIEWTEAQFSVWRNSKAGRQAFDLDTLATEKTAAASGAADEDGDTDMEECVDDFEICDRKKCARHLEWGKLAVDDLRFEMTDNSDHMRSLDREEKEIRERAALRSKAGRLEGEGRVEVHGLGISVDEPRSAEAMETV